MELAETGFAADQIDVFDGATAAGRGIVLVGGPCDATRSATLRGLLAHLSSSERSLFAAEPTATEGLSIPGVSHTRVADPPALSQWLWAVLQADADVIMVAEMPSAGVAALLVRASRGAIVLIGVDCLSSTEALLKLIGYGLPARTVSAVVTGIICRWDVPRLCPHCRHQLPAGAGAQSHRLLRAIGAPETRWGAPGCENCGGTGQAGTVPLVEAVSVGTVVGPLLADLANHPALVRAGRNATAMALAQSAVEGLRAGEIAEASLTQLLSERLTAPAD
jgi:type II secretory ATPase GspE/PulE/Tfp pilus assembly ATPase PilB-like protein